MFIDETVIEVQAGDGGNGCCAYERTRSRPKGRATGGSGGRGGHIVIRGSSQLHTLQDCSYRRHYRAERGAHGKGSNWTGRSAEDVTIDVPLGTMVYDTATETLLHDCVHDGRTFVVARGGWGGRGNADLVSRKNPSPQGAEHGQAGQCLKLRLTLKVLADVGLVGRPNAGKSTLLSRISRARPAIADYPFTTTEPHLGIVAFAESFDSMVVADIPGLIEDSHKGKGLGIRFLRHIERTRVLAVMVESTSQDPRGDADVLVSELRAYSEVLAAKPICFVLSKTDLLAEGHTAPPGWVALSSVTGQGLDELLSTLRSMLREVPGAGFSEADEPPACGSDS